MNQIKRQFKNYRIRIASAAFVFFAIAASGCGGANLQHMGFTNTNKVWYHWDKGHNDHVIVVCDVMPDGSEANCNETHI